MNSELNSPTTQPAPQCPHSSGIGVAESNSFHAVSCRDEFCSMIEACTCPTKAGAIARLDVNHLVFHLRKELSPQNIPEELKRLKGWLVWKTSEIQTSGKFNKVPYYPRSGERRSGQQGSPRDRQKLGTFEDAMTAFGDCQYAGIGLAMLPEWGLVGFDADSCVDQGVLSEKAEMLTEGTYREISPSGTGVRAFWRGEAIGGKSGGFELYTRNQFLTITGRTLGGDLPEYFGPFILGEWPRVGYLNGTLSGTLAVFRYPGSNVA